MHAEFEAVLPVSTFSQLQLTSGDNFIGSPIFLKFAGLVNSLAQVGRGCPQ
jgi:hypothetical protein